MRFTKMHGAGNDYVYVDLFDQPMPDDPAELAIAVSDRHRGVGGDGLILIGPSDVAEARMRMWNADGSPGEMCGNGLRSVGKYLYDRGRVEQTKFVVETAAGLRGVVIEESNGRTGQVTVDMGRPVLVASEIPTSLPGEPPLEVSLAVGEESLIVSALSMGNPHCVLFEKVLTDERIARLGPAIENHPAFPNRTNVEFTRVLSPAEIQLRVWERGSGETQACGTGACAAVVAGCLTGRLDRRVACQLPGGTLTVHWDESDIVHLSGPAVEVFSGEWRR